MKRLLKWFLVLVLLAGAGAGGWYYFRLQQIERFAKAPFGSTEDKRVEIPNGTGPRALAKLLFERGVVSDADLFYWVIRSQQAGPKLKAGEYEFTEPITPAEVLNRIVSGQVKLYRFTVPEGLRVEEILPILANSELKLDLEKLKALTSDVAFLKKANVPAGTMEGFLYPDTYSFTRGADEQAVLLKMAERTQQEFKAAYEARKQGVDFTLIQALTLASIVEKETGAVEERPRISCVFHNRLKLDMKLQTDPTVLYAMKLLRGEFIKNISSKDLVTDHPYNTYMRKGLPPGPIANPGAAAIRAALHPIECKDLFFVSMNNGTHVFCPDLKCHNAAVEEWQRSFFRKKKSKKRG